MGTGPRGHSLRCCPAPCRMGCQTPAGPTAATRAGNRAGGRLPGPSSVPPGSPARRGFTCDPDPCGPAAAESSGTGRVVGTARHPVCPVSVRDGPERWGQPRPPPSQGRRRNQLGMRMLPSGLRGASISPCVQMLLRGGLGDFIGTCGGAELAPVLGDAGGRPSWTGCPFKHQPPFPPRSSCLSQPCLRTGSPGTPLGFSCGPRNAVTVCGRAACPVAPGSCRVSAASKAGPLPPTPPPRPSPQRFRPVFTFNLTSGARDGAPALSRILSSSPALLVLAMRRRVVTGAAHSRTCTLTHVHAHAHPHT